MQRGHAGVVPAPGSTTDAGPPRNGGDDRPALRTEFAFELPRGYVDQDGTLHRSGVMRLATARDELLPLYDARVQENAATPRWCS
jgi:hypothetical protein